MAPVSLLTEAGPRGKALLHAALRRGRYLPLEGIPAQGAECEDCARGSTKSSRDHV